MADAFGDVLQRSGDHHPAVGESEQDDLVETLVQHLIDDVLNVRRQRDLRTRQVRALAESREARRERLVAGRLQAAPDVAEAVCTRPGAVDEDEGTHAGTAFFQ